MLILFDFANGWCGFGLILCILRCTLMVPPQAFSCDILSATFCDDVFFVGCPGHQRFQRSLFGVTPQTSLYQEGSQSGRYVLARQQRCLPIWVVLNENRPRAGDTSLVSCSFCFLLANQKRKIWLHRNLFCCSMPLCACAQGKFLWNQLNYLWNQQRCNNATQTKRSWNWHEIQRCSYDKLTVSRRILLQAHHISGSCLPLSGRS